ncbi:MAG TPA: hypothetical protein VN133_05715 [Humibacter sp.]|nr:hypothetical protein [Humibacter sp.]
MDWLTTDTVDAWPQAPTAAKVQQVLDAAKAAILAFDAGYCWGITTALNTDADGNAVAWPGDYPAGQVPSALVMAERMHARRVWAASRVDPSNTGKKKFTPVDIPLDWVAKQVARPKRTS